MADNLERTRQHFIAWTDYHEQVSSWFSELYQNAGTALSSRLRGRVLDVGNGGVFNYSLTNVDSLVTLDIAEGAWMESLPSNKIECRIGDARDIPFEEGEFDRVVMQYLLHHLAERNLRETDQGVEKCLAEAYRVLKQSGKILIVESCLPPVLERIENIGYGLLWYLVKFFDFPMVKQYSLPSLLQMVKGVGFREITAVEMNKGRYVSQLGIRTPAKLTPVKVHLVEGTKA